MYQLHGCSLGSSSALDLALPSRHTADSRGDKSSVDYQGLGNKRLTVSAEAMLTALMASACVLAVDFHLPLQRRLQRAHSTTTTMGDREPPVSQHYGETPTLPRKHY